MKIYYLKLKLTEEQVYNIIPILPEDIADDLINQIEKRNEYTQTQDYFKRYYEEHKVEMLAQHKEYYLKNREKICERNKRWRQANPDYNKQYRIENLERVRAKEKRYRERNREEINRKRREKRKLKKEEQC